MSYRSSKAYEFAVKQVECGQENNKQIMCGYNQSLAT